MNNTRVKIISKYLIPIIMILGFTLWFCYDIYTLKKTLIQPDIFTYYYPYRHWFTEKVLHGVFPLWNPYWGIGQSSEVWATIPIDIYTPLEMIFGPQYHYFLALQAFIIMLAGFYVFIKLGFKHITAAAASILYFMTPWVTYFYFYFLVGASFIGNMFLFCFVFLWHKTEKLKYLYLIAVITLLSMLGTKVEFWFFNAFLFTFYTFMSSILFYSGSFKKSLKIFFLSMFAFGIGTLSQLWQLNIITKVMNSSDRFTNLNKFNIFSPELYHNFFLSIVDSQLIKIIVIAIIFYLAMLLKNRIYKVLLVLVALTIFWINFMLVPDIELYLFKFIILGTPVIFGAVIAFLILRNFFKLEKFTPKDHFKTALLFLLFVFYWCRTQRGDLGELEIIQSAPFLFKMLLSFFVYIGCSQFQKSKLVKLAYFSILFVFFMREQGQIILSYLAGLLWIPTRDNYIIDFATTIIAVSGLAKLELLFNKFKWNDAVQPASIVFVAAIIFFTPLNHYYVHWMMAKTPPNYPYYNGISRINETIKNLNRQPLSRIFIINDQNSQTATYGFGESLFSEVGQITQYTSIVPKRYKNWTTYKELGIKPDQEWSAYTGDYTAKTLSRLPAKNMLGYNNDQVFFYSVRAIPPSKLNELRLLGVEYVMKMYAALDNIQWSRSKKINQEIKRLNLTNTREENGIFVGKIKNPLPRAYLVDNVINKNIKEFMEELNPVVDENNKFIKTASYKFNLSPAVIKDYKAEHVSLSVNAKKDSYLVLSDVFHPFWKAKVDNKNVEIIPAFYLFRAVKVPKGNHNIDFYCEIPYFVLCVDVSILIIFLLITSPFLYQFYKNSLIKEENKV